MHEQPDLPLGPLLDAREDDPRRGMTTCGGVCRTLMMQEDAVEVPLPSGDVEHSCGQESCIERIHAMHPPRQKLRAA